LTTDSIQQPRPGSAIRLIGIDVDGTLVGSSGQVDSRIWKAAERARAAGIHLALCSGRPAFGLALEYARQLESDGWHVFQNGASILHLAAPQSLSVPLAPAWVKTLVSQARDGTDVLELYSDDAYVTESTSAWAVKHAVLLGVPFEARPFESLQRPVVRAQWLVPAARAKEIKSAEHAGVEVAESTSPLMPDTRFVGFTNEGVSKGSAMRAIAARYGIDLRDVMYVGDAGNDIPALRIVGHPIAMGNADPAVLAVATHRVGHVDEAGLVEALQLAIANGQ
jgi:Cof subfamily protein (haloacid dehalogenase superfamily)